MNEEGYVLMRGFGAELTFLSSFNPNLKWIFKIFDRMIIRLKVLWSHTLKINRVTKSSIEQF